MVRYWWWLEMLLWSQKLDYDISAFVIRGEMNSECRIPKENFGADFFVEEPCGE